MFTTWFLVKGKKVLEKNFKMAQKARTFWPEEKKLENKNQVSPVQLMKSTTQHGNKLEVIRSEIIMREK